MSAPDVAKIAHPPSYWAASAQPTPLRPTLKGAIDCDVVIIGAGYTGLSAALHLAKRGMKVIVLESARVGWGASGRNGGLLIPGQRNDAETLIATHGPDHAKRLFDLALDGRALLASLITDHAIACDLQFNGYVHAALTPAAAKACAHEVDRLHNIMGYPHAEALSAAEIQNHVASPRYQGGMLDRQGGHIHPLNYAIGLAKAAEQAGAIIHENAPVFRLDEGPTTTAHTAQGSVKARFAIVANDAFAGNVDAKLGAWVMPVGNCLIATQTLGNFMGTLLPSNAAVSDTKFVLDYFRPTADGRLVFGGGERYTPGDPPDIAAFVRPYLTKVFPQLANIHFTHAWSGTVSVTRSRNPCFGRRGSLFWAIGYSGLGVIMATLGGALIAEAVRGTADRFDVMAKLPGDPWPGGPLARDPLYVAGMLWYALRDRIGLRLAGQG
jgi:gamma-glutamylputrescine oxidase